MCEGAWPLSKLSYTNSVRLGSVDAEWITMKKDWQEAKKRSKAQQKEAIAGCKDILDKYQPDPNNPLKEGILIGHCVFTIEIINMSF